MITASHCARNNADLYQAVFRAHNIADTRTPEAWSSSANAPPYYSNFVALSEASGTELSKQISKLKRELTPPFSVKDSFAKLEIAKLGFSILFEATWISRSVHRVVSNLPIQWKRVSSESDFARWQNAWQQSSPTEERVFIPKMLADPQLAFFAREDDGVFTAGCLANQSTDAIGLSNVFYAESNSDCFKQSAACLDTISMGLPIVGYENGEALKLAIAAGFQEVGPLRIWIKS
jgi:hypothetical protein